MREERWSATRDGEPKNDPKLFTLVKVKTLRPFAKLGDGTPVMPGDVVLTERWHADDLIYLKKAEAIP